MAGTYFPWTRYLSSRDTIVLLFTPDLVRDVEAGTARRPGAMVAFYSFGGHGIFILWASRLCLCGTALSSPSAGRLFRITPSLERDMGAGTARLPAKCWRNWVAIGIKVW